MIDLPLPALAAILITIAYLAGSIPFGWIIAKKQGVNIFEHGSGNIGATNVGRVLGRKWGLLCFALDVTKGLLPTLGAGWALGTLGHFTPPIPEAMVWMGAMVATVLGHMVSPWLGFKGGKGVATGLGAMAGVFPLLTIAVATAAVIWVISVKITRYVSVASCLAAASLPLSVGLLSVALPNASPHKLWPFLLAVGCIAALVVWKHRGNIARIRRGEEPQITKGHRAK